MTWKAEMIFEKDGLRISNQRGQGAEHVYTGISSELGRTVGFLRVKLPERATG